jgi:hypothetical protein
MSKVSSFSVMAFSRSTIFSVFSLALDALASFCCSQSVS